MMRSIRLNPLCITSYGASEHGTMLVTKRFGSTEIFILSDSPEAVKAKLSHVRGLFPGTIEFELASV